LRLEEAKEVRRRCEKVFHFSTAPCFVAKPLNLFYKELTKKGKKLDNILIL
jgi:hypothetical protein